MARVSSISGLSPEQHAAVDTCIRRYRYVDLAGMLETLKLQGIFLSKSALHRYVQKQQIKDGLHAGTSDDVVVVIVERSTGDTTTLTTGVSKAALIGLIEGLKVQTADLS